MSGDLADGGNDFNVHDEVIELASLGANPAAGGIKIDRFSAKKQKFSAIRAAYNQDEM